MEKRVLVSACLLGEKCRYDGQSKPDKRVINALKGCLYAPVCPEVLGGLPTPRKPSEIKNGRVIMCDGTDVTAQYKTGAQAALEIAQKMGCTVAVMKSRSPSCGKGIIYDGTYTKTLTKGDGICAELLMANGISVIDETEIEKLENEDYSK